MTTNPSTETTELILPVSLFEDLLPKLVDILEITQQAEGATTLQARQKLLQATNAFKTALSSAKEYAQTLPGGELTLAQQDEIIELLQRLKERKRAQMAAFAVKPDKSANESSMDVDSDASSHASPNAPA